MAEFLTTRELADLLRIGERKAYDLAASGEEAQRRKEYERGCKYTTREVRRIEYLVTRLRG